VEEVGEGKPTPQLFNQGHFEAKTQLLGAISEQRCGSKPRQSQFEAGRPSRWRCCRAISESSGHPIQVPFFVHGSRDLGEQDQISLETIRQM
jgi:hypothetical protein